MKSLLLKIGYIKHGINNISKFNIFDQVLSNGKFYTLMNGPSAPLWSCLEVGKMYISDKIMIHEKDMKKVHDFKTWLRNIRTIYFFYMDSWMDIHLRKFSFTDIIDMFFLQKNVKSVIDFALWKK